MAQMIPETVPRSSTAGERLLFTTLRENLPDNYIVYYEPTINGKKPDYVVIGPDMGVLVLEVKDYTENTLYELNSNEWRLHTSEGKLTSVINPMTQARNYAFAITNKLKKDTSLIQTEGKYIGNLKFPYGYGVVFTRMKQIHLARNNVFAVIPDNLILSRDEIDSEDEDFSTEGFLEKLMGMFSVKNSGRGLIDEEDIQSIRYHLFPEVRISADVKRYSEDSLLSLKNIKAMDLYQEILAKQLGEGHRAIRGVAGSGKTIILAARARILLEKYPDWKLLVLCYGVPLSRNIRVLLDNMLNRKEELDDVSAVALGSAPNIAVKAFHEWLREDLKCSDNEIETLMSDVESGKRRLPVYDAILIDEGQDFESSWLKIVSLCLNKETGSLLLVEDRAQDIYKRKSSLAKDTGLDFRGRSKILNINYRNTAEILNFAWDFYKTHAAIKDKVKQELSDVLEIIPPRGSKRSGPAPKVLRLQSMTDEVKLVAQLIERIHVEKKIPYSEFAILYRVKKDWRGDYAELAIKAMKWKKIPYYWITENQAAKKKFNRNDQTVKISTIDSAKGLDFKVVFIINVDNMPFKLEESKEREISLLYIAMTRASEILYLLFSGDSEFTRYLESTSQTSDGKTKTMNLF
jgi:predicted acetyltransferase